MRAASLMPGPSPAYGYNRESRGMPKNPVITGVLGLG